LLRRGPDDFDEKQINCSLSNNDEKTFGEGHHTSSSNGCNFIHLAAVVLHLRGDCIARQPLEDSFGNILAWNGEIFDGIEVR
jgi:asparagine synthetase B (glutamine-hydrolysing)